jgi:hypothetical protein
MDITAILILLAIFVGGVMVGYGIRSLVSKKRRERARRRGAYFYHNPEQEVTQSETADASVHAGKFGSVSIFRSIFMTLMASPPRASVESGPGPADREQPSEAKGEIKALPLTACPQWTIEEDTPQAQRINLPSAVADIYRAVADLEKLYPGRKFTPDGRLVGSIGEVIAAEHFGLTLLSKAGHGAFDANGDVQIKLTAGNSLSKFTDCARLIVLRIVSPEQAELVYDGPGASAWAAAGSMQKNGQRKIALTKLRLIAEQASDSGTKAETQVGAKVDSSRATT